MVRLPPGYRPFLFPVVTVFIFKPPGPTNQGDCTNKWRNPPIHDLPKIHIFLHTNIHVSEISYCILFKESI